MRSISIQIQPVRSPGIDMPRIMATFEVLTKNTHLVQHHCFENGQDGDAYSNFTFGTLDVKNLWQLIKRDFYNDSILGPHMRQASIAMCSSEDGWDNYAQLYHFDPNVSLDAELTP